MLVYTARMK